MLSPSVGSSFVDHLDVQDKKVANYNLSHAFGSKKAKRVADQRARMEVNVDSVKEKLSTTVKGELIFPLPVKVVSHLYFLHFCQ